METQEVKTNKTWEDLKVGQTVYEIDMKKMRIEQFKCSKIETIVRPSRNDANVTIRELRIHIHRGEPNLKNAQKIEFNSFLVSPTSVNQHTKTYELKEMKYQLEDENYKKREKENIVYYFESIIGHSMTKKTAEWFLRALLRHEVKEWRERELIRQNKEEKQ
jgi:hypothetical protein